MIAPAPCHNCTGTTIVRDGALRCTGCGLPIAYCPDACGRGAAYEDRPEWDAE